MPIKPKEYTQPWNIHRRSVPRNCSEMANDTMTHPQTSKIQDRIQRQM